MAACLADAMVHLTNLAKQMDQMKVYLKLTDKPRVAHLVWQTTKHVSRPGYLARRMPVPKGSLINLDLHLAVM